MPDKTQKEILDKLNNLDANLNLYLNLFKLVNGEKIDEIKQKLLENKTRRKIYDLCDGTKNVKEIVPLVGIAYQNVYIHLNKLTSAGLLSYKVDGNKRYYFKTLE